MKKILLVVLLASALFFGFERMSETQTKPEKIQSEQDKNKPKIVALKSDESKSFAYDAGSVRFLASSEDTGGAWGVVELTEMPGYKTPWHRHNHTDETYYVQEGVFTVKIADRTYEFPAGSYVVIPRGTPHAQGNFGKVPVKTLLTMTPGGFERFFMERVELFKTVKPESSEFTRKLIEIGKKQDIEILGSWDIQK